MKLIEGIKQQGSPFYISNYIRRDLLDFFIDLGFTVGVEVGVNRGSFTRIFCEVGLKIYGIDPYMRYDGYSHLRKCTLDRLYEQAEIKLAVYPNCTLVRKTSVDAAKDFEDGSIDFVYIDGNHLTKHVFEDICAWSDKVRVGGIISGHDYNLETVEKAVKSYVEIYGIKNWFVLGKEELPLYGHIDKGRCWMWMKT